MDCGLDNTIKCMCVWWVVGVRIIVWSRGGEWLREERGRAPERTWYSNVGIWLDSQVINRYIKNKRRKGRLGEKANECSFGYVGLC